jgi:hypothetical protein
VVILPANRNGSVTVESELLFPALLRVLWPTFTVCSYICMSLETQGERKVRTGRRVVIFHSVQSYVFLDDMLPYTLFRT